MKNKQLIIVIIIFVVIAVSGSVGFYFYQKSENLRNEDKVDENNNKSDEKQEEKKLRDGKYYIYYYDDYIPGSSSVLEMDEKGNYSLKVRHFSSAIDVGTSVYTYEDTLNSNQLLKVRAILEYLCSNEKFISNDEYAFYYDYNEFDISRKENSILEDLVSAIENISRKDENIDDTTRYEFGNQYLDSIIEDLKIEVDIKEDEYRKIEFMAEAYNTGSSIKISKDTVFDYKYQDGVVYLNDNRTIIEESFGSICAIDIDEDGVKEIITRTIDDSISPPTNYYHIYKVKNNEFKEIAKMDIIGTIDYFYIKGKDIKVKYYPYETPPGYEVEEHFEIIE